MSSAFPLPPNLPQPIDDGACEHLPGARIPSIALSSTSGRIVNLGALTAPRTVIYCYPMTGVPGKPLPSGWDLIPGARGCTPQSCGFRDSYRKFLDLSCEVYGLSTQTTEYQREVAARLGIPFDILSDAKFEFCDALRLPTFEVEGMRLIKRLTLVIRNNEIERVFYPVFPPDQNANEVFHWLQSRGIQLAP
jgi:peroxiredoxin